METFNFGGLHVKKDKRDYKLEMVGASIAIPETFRPDYSMIPVLHQHSTPTCGAHAGATLKMIQEYYDKTKKPNYTARLLWKEIKKVDGHDLEAGTDIYSLLKTLRVPSVCDLSVLDNNTTLPLEEYTHFIATPEMYDNAKEKLITNFATTGNPTFDQIKQAIYINKAVLILMRVGPNMYRPSWNEKDILPLKPHEYVMDSGHFVCAIGYDKDYIYFRNSWGEGWGRAGDGYFGADYVKWVNMIGTAIDKKDVTSEVIPPPIYEGGQVKNWWERFVFLQNLAKKMGLIK